ncbi:MULTISPECIES: AMP-binding protein [unclassified Serratia (in: enterobacteria)]|uniref:AMP-binding protein n=1 Tax=unclassified Serratia (in: enterobacteria) TaxID=2647522 RepID=UPI003076157F
MQNKNLTALVVDRCKNLPEQKAYTFLNDALDEEASWNYGELYQQIIFWVRKFNAIKDKELFLAFPPGLDFIAAFLACSCSGKVAIPIPLPSKRNKLRFKQITDICASTTLVTTIQSYAKIKDVCTALESNINIITNGDYIDEEEPEINFPDSEKTAFIQFTSGSTSCPKGVKVTHRNILANQKMIAESFGHNSKSRVLGWLPATHDMGLIGIILQPLYAAIPCWLMSPAHFSRIPGDWLRAISRYQITTSGGPNFAYNLCLNFQPDNSLDLSCWQVAFNGAEPIMHNTLQKFYTKFGAYGFREEAFLPCYGLAEATLFVTGKGSLLPVVMEKEVVEHDVSQKKCWVSSGRSHPWTTIKIIDSVTRQVKAEGEIGEIWVAGPSITQGYYRLPLQQQPFGYVLGDEKNPMLKTGDLGFIYHNELFVTGRLKDLIIINGVNIYPQDIEHAISDLENRVAFNAVAAFEYENDSQKSIGLAIEISRQYRHEWLSIARNLHQQVINLTGVQVGRIVALAPGQLPRTTSGKIQRHRCRQIASDLCHSFIGVYPTDKGAIQTSCEPKHMPLDDATQIFLDIINSYTIEQVDPSALHKTLPELGVDSISTMKAASEINHRFGTSLTNEVLEGDSTLGEMLNNIRRSGASILSPQSVTDNKYFTGLSRLQLRYAMLDQLAQLASPPTVNASIRFTGDIDERLLARCLLNLTKRHDAFWLKFENGMLVDGASYQEPETLPFEIIPCGPEEQQIHREAFLSRNFDANAPLYRFALLQLQGKSTGSELLICAHHIIFDGWSLDILVNELSTMYDAGMRFIQPNLAPCTSYQMFEPWIEQHFPYSNLRTQFASLSEFTSTPDLPGETDYPEKNGHFEYILPDKIRQDVLAIAKQLSLSPMVIWISLYGLLIAKLSGQQKLLVGTPLALRDAPGSVNNIGLYLNIVPVKIDITTPRHFTDYCQNVATSIEEIKAYGGCDIYIPVNDSDEIGQRFNPEFFFNYLPNYHHQGTFGDIHYQLTPHLAQTAHFDTTLYIIEKKEKSNLLLTWKKGKFSQEKAARFIEQLLQLLQYVTMDRQKLLADCTLIPATMWQQPEPCIWQGSVVQQAYRWASVTPERTAIEFGQYHISWKALVNQADCIGKQLVAQCVQPGDIVAIIATRTPSLVTAILATLRVNAVFAIIDGSWPSERIDKVLSIANYTQFIDLRENSPYDTLFSPETFKRALDQDECVISTLPPLAHQPDDPACLTFTSGTSGVPKAVLGSHHGLSAFLPWQEAQFSLNQSDRISLLSGLAHDPLQRDIFTAWWTGATLVIPENNIISESYLFSDWFRKSRITVTNLTPSVAQLFTFEANSATSLPALRYLFLVGETITRQQIQRLEKAAPNATVVTLYGATETQRALMHAVSDRSQQGPVTLGTSPPGMKLYVLDPVGKVAAVGQPGKLVIASPHLAKGYYARGELLPLPSAHQPGQDYVTGDWGYYLSNGEIICTGRKDRQLNIRGYRVEAGDIESSALSLPGVAFARAKWFNDTQLLVLFVQLDGIDCAQLYTHLQQALPQYMLPQRIEETITIPLTANGKLDESALTLNDRPEMEMQNTVVSPLFLSCINETLGTVSVNPDLSFIQAGGTSLKALHLQSTLHSQYQLLIPLATIINAPSIRELVIAIVALVPNDAEKMPIITADSAQTDTPFPLNDIQSAYVAGRQQAISQSKIASQSYYEYQTHNLNLSRFEAAWNRVIRHHAGLRTRLVEGWLQQSPAETPWYDIHVDDLSHLSVVEQQERLTKKRDKLANEQFDLMLWPLFLLEASVLSSELTLLHFRIDYVIADAWSWNIILSDLHAFYSGQTEQLSHSEIHFRDYVLAERKWKQSPAYRENLRQKAQLIGQYFNAPQLPLIKTIESITTPHFNRLSHTLPSLSWSLIQTHAKEANITPTVLLVTLLGKVISHWSTDKKLTLNLTTFDRKGWHQDVPNIVGDFTSLLLLPMDFSGDHNLRTLCEINKAHLLENMGENQPSWHRNNQGNKSECN